MRKVTIPLHPIFGLLIMLVVIAAFITIPVIAFYVLPLGLVRLASWIVSFVGWHIPFNIVTWAIAMYLLWITGVVRPMVRKLKSELGNIRAE